MLPPLPNVQTPAGPQFANKFAPPPGHDSQPLNQNGPYINGNASDRSHSFQPSYAPHENQQHPQSVQRIEGALGNMNISQGKAVPPRMNQPSVDQFMRPMPDGGAFAPRAPMGGMPGVPPPMPATFAPQQQQHQVQHQPQQQQYQAQHHQPQQQQHPAQHHQPPQQQHPAQHQAQHHQPMGPPAGGGGMPRPGGPPSQVASFPAAPAPPGVPYGQSDGMQRGPAPPMTAMHQVAPVRPQPPMPPGGGVQGMPPGPTMRAPPPLGQAGPPGGPPFGHGGPPLLPGPPQLNQAAGPIPGGAPAIQPHLGFPGGSGPAAQPPLPMGHQFPASGPSFGDGGTSMMQPGGPGGFGAGPMGGGPMQAAQRRLDPNAMPSAVQVMDDDRRSRSGKFQTGFPRAEMPPLVTTDFFCEDQGNCMPAFMRSTLYSVPANQDLVKQSAIPFAVSICPLARQHPMEAGLPLVDFGASGPVRCHRCKAYICPQMEFFDGGRRFKCPFCKSSSEVPESYFGHLDHTGRRVDLPNRPELYLGSYECVATKEYCKNGIVPKAPAFVFLLDVSYNSVRNGVVNLFCANIKRLLQELPRDTMDQSTVRVAFATYDQTVHFYNLKSAVGQPQMLVVGDVQEMFVPLVDGFMVNVDEAEAAIDSLLQQIPQMFNESRVTDVVLGPAVQAGMEALKAADRAGKLFVFHSSLPTFEAPGKLKNRDDRKLLGTDKEKPLLTPQSDFYEKLAQECVSAGCCVDAYLFPNAYIDIATIGTLCGLTGGQVFKYLYFQPDLDGKRFLNDLKHDISRPIMFDAIMRLRTSTGIRPTDFYGNFFMSNTTDVELAALDSDKCVSIEIRHDDKLDEAEGAFLQTAVLFTSCGGHRRLRVHSLALQCTSELAQLYRGADLDTIMNFLAKQGGRSTLQKGARDMREALVGRCAQMLATYRSKCATASSAGQLILPEGMKLLPLYVNCVIKNDAICGGSDIGSDDRAWLMQSIPSMRVLDSLVYFYPRVFPLVDEKGSVDIDDVPAPVRCSYENLAPHGAYLFENGVVMFIWLGQNLSSQWIQDVFGVQSLAHINTEKNELPELDTPVARRLHAIISKLHIGRTRSMKLFIIRQQDKLEPWFKHFLVEDQGIAQGGVPAPSYVDFLCHIHKEIRNLLS